jgi:hypothetical protein
METLWGDARYARALFIGVAPPGFRFPERSDIWVPLQARYARYKSDKHE